MTDITHMLSDLDVEAPQGLAQETLIQAGAADQVTTVDSPFGPLWIAWSTKGVTGVTPRFSCETAEGFLDAHRRNGYAVGRLPKDLSGRIDDALEGGETHDVPVDLRGLAEFQQSVLIACSAIDPGSVRTYGWIADELNNPGAVRAVGTALGRNPVPLIVPCHRVVRSDGSIGNYAFGADMKRALLLREGAILA